MARAGVAARRAGGVAASGGPGLIGGLIVGSGVAKGVALAAGLPFVAVNHLEAHALTARLPGLVPGGVAFPYLLLLVSGGHCQCVAVEGLGRYRAARRHGGRCGGGGIRQGGQAARAALARRTGPGAAGGGGRSARASRSRARCWAGPDAISASPASRRRWRRRWRATRRARLPARRGRHRGLVPARGCRGHGGPGGQRDAAVATRTAREACWSWPAGWRPTRRCARRWAAAEARGFRLVAPPPRLCTDNAVMVAWAGIERLRSGLPMRSTSTPGRAGRWTRRTCAGELPPRLPRRQLRGLHEARAAGLAGAGARPQADAVLRAGYPRGGGAVRPGQRPGGAHGRVARRHRPPAGRPAAQRWPTMCGWCGGWACIRDRRRSSAHCCGRRPAGLLRAASGGLRRILRRRFARDPQVAVHRRDGWEALRALLPPKERRGLVLIDPPYEQRRRVRAAWPPGCAPDTRRSAPAVFAALVPDQAPRPGTRVPCRACSESGMRDVVAAELLLREPTRPRAAERLRPAGRQPALSVRGRRPRHPGRAAGPAGDRRARRGHRADPARR